MYELQFSSVAQKYLKKLREKPLKLAFKNALTQLSENPYLGTAKTGDLSGLYGFDLFYNKTNYEISYRIQEETQKIVIVILIGTRENFYNELKRFLK